MYVFIDVHSYSAGNKKLLENVRDHLRLFLLHCHGDLSVSIMTDSGNYSSSLYDLTVADRNLGCNVEKHFAAAIVYIKDFLSYSLFIFLLHHLIDVIPMKIVIRNDQNQDRKCIYIFYMYQLNQ